MASCYSAPLKSETWWRWDRAPCWCALRCAAGLGRAAELPQGSQTCWDCAECCYTRAGLSWARLEGLGKHGQAAWPAAVFLFNALTSTGPLKGMKCRASSCCTWQRHCDSMLPDAEPAPSR